MAAARGSTTRCAAPSSNTNAYRLVARFAGNGSTYLSASRVVNGAETQIGSAVVVPTVNFVSGFTLRGQVTGTNPTTIRIKAWVGTEPETWQYTGTDSAGPQVAGRGGLRTLRVRPTQQRPADVPVRQLLGQRDGDAPSAPAAAAASAAAAAAAPAASPAASAAASVPPPPPPPPPAPAAASAAGAAAASAAADADG